MPISNYHTQRCENECHSSQCITWGWKTNYKTEKRDIEEISKDRMQCVKDINMKETDEVMKSKNTSSMEGMNPIEAVSKNIFILCTDMEWML